MARDTRETTEAPADPFESALPDFVETYRGHIHPDWAAKILRNEAEQITKDPEWIYDGEASAPDEEAAVLTMLQPWTAVVGDITDVTLEVIGTGITPSSIIVFNGGEEPTTYVDETKVTTIVRPSTAGAAVTLPVLVRNGDIDSNALDFTFVDEPVARRGNDPKKGLKT